MNKIGTEKLTFSKMIRIYCKKRHKTAKGLCLECKRIEEYAHLRLEKCIYGEAKPNCKNCPIHCYKPDMRHEAKQIMRVAGPHMIYHHPILAIKHLINRRSIRK